MLTEYQTPAALQRAGAKQLADWLARRAVRSAADVAARGLEAARTQVTALPGEKRPAKLVCDLAHQLLMLDEWIKDTDREIREAFRLDERAEFIESLPGMGPILGAEFLAIVGDLSSYADAGRLAAHAGLAPVSRDSGRRTGNHHRPQALPPPPATRLLHGRPNRDDAPRPLSGLLPQEARRRTDPHPGPARPRTPSSRRLMGHAP